MILFVFIPDLFVKLNSKIFCSGFCWETPENIPNSLHTSFSSAFSKLDEANIFQYDTVQPGRKRLSRTFVTRTLVGNPGSTYRYLGLRLFSHPWCDVDEIGNSIRRSKNAKSMNIGSSLVSLGYEKSTANALILIGNINSVLIERSNKLLKEKIAESVPEKLVGSAEFSLTLINKMEPSSLKKDLKRENIYGMGKASVSWHMDSGLQDFSTIAVYHELLNLQTTPARDTNTKEPWRVALRISGEENKRKSPPLSVPLPSGTLYYMLDDFNHKHEHAVLAGTNKLRYSSTHRVAREGNGTWQYIRDKCRVMLDNVVSISSLSNGKNKKSDSTIVTVAMRKAQTKQVRKQQQLFQEIEFEWIRQWLVQGTLHANLHPYWHAPIEMLKKYYVKLEGLTVDVLRVLQASAESKESTNEYVCEELFDVLIEAFSEKSKLRKEWKMRVNDPIFNKMDSLMQPIKCNILDRPVMTDPDKQLNSNLSQTIDDLRLWRAKFVNLKEKRECINKSGKHRKRKLSSKPSNLTRKEQRKVASNWQKMKLTL